MFFVFQFFQLEQVAFANSDKGETNWKYWGKKEEVPKNKTWTVKFSQPVDVDSLTDENIYVVDSYNGKIPVSFSLSNEGKDLLIEAPFYDYYPYETYTLYIENVKSQNQQVLKEPIKMDFTVNEKQIIVESEKLVPRKDSKNEVNYQDNVELISEKQSQLFQVIDVNTLVLESANTSLEKGDILILPPSDEYPFGLSKKIISIEKGANQFVIKTEEPTLEEIVEHIDISQRIPITMEHVKGDLSLKGATIASTDYKFLNESSNTKILNNGVIASQDLNDDIILTLGKLKIGDNYYVDGAITLKNADLFVDVNDSWWWKGVETGVVEFEGTIDIKGAINAKKSNKENKLAKRVKITDLYVPVPAFPVVGASIELFLVIDLNGEVRLEYNKKMDFRLGASFDDGKIQKINDVDYPEEEPLTNKSTFTGEINFNGKLGIGAGLYLSLTQIDLAGLEMDAGLKTKLASYLYKGTVCYKGSNSLYFDAGINVKVFKTKVTLLGIEKLLDNGNICEVVEELEVYPSELALQPGKSETIYVEKVFKAGGSDYTLKDISFTSSDQNVATVDEEGVVTISKNATDEDSAEIIVTYNNGKNEIKKTIKVNVFILEDEEDDDENAIKESQIIDGSSHYVRKIAFSSDGQTMAFSSDGDPQNIEIWRKSNDEYELDYIITNAHNDHIGALAISPDGKYLASGGGEIIYLWDIQTGEKMETYIETGSDMEKMIIDVAFSPDGSTLVSADWYDSLNVWDVNSGNLIRSLLRDSDIKYESSSWSVAFSPDGSMFAYGGGNDTTYLRNATNLSIIRSLPYIGADYWKGGSDGWDSAIRSVKFTKDGQQIITASSEDNTVKIWSLNGELQKTIQTDHSDIILDMDIHPGQRVIATSAEDGVVKLWDKVSGQLITTLYGHYGGVTTIKFSPDGKQLATGSYDGRVIIWDLP
ncbi:Ig-like domain-containing protein [Lysinibacillus endophyticus]|uniref:Ig-like domain-containing protein n=1 Tax=Ureibacillus endophyticus TaxID=1978490 RepID=UPI00209DA9E1|nr:Ig-like domain-containing protein [Lysinibacillus endophyticus]MCP1143694.1 Ig-like domain-containing protein [Lysinibacillus endophyticus]